MSLNFEKMGGILPAIIQDAGTGEVLMLGFMNRESYKRTVSGGKVCFYSRTKDRLWTKGEESGNYLNVVEIHEDCDEDTLLIRVDPEGPVCHTGQRSCFGDLPGMFPAGKREGLGFLIELQDILVSRKTELPEDSYTAGLFREGINKIARKVGEEAVELLIESKDKNDERFLNEAADLLFHLMILLVERGFRLEHVAGILTQRR